MDLTFVSDYNNFNLTNPTRTYSAKTNVKGQATFKITKLTKKGIFKAVITFAGTQLYWTVLPLSYGISYTDLNIGVLFFYAIFSFADFVKLSSSPIHQTMK